MTSSKLVPVYYYIRRQYTPISSINHAVIAFHKCFYIRCVV